MSKLRCYNTSLIEAVKLVYDEVEDEALSDAAIESEIRYIFRFADENWMLQQIKQGLASGEPGFHHDNGYLDTDWIVYAAKNESSLLSKSLSFKETICLESILNETLLSLERQGIIKYNRSQIFNMGSVMLADDIMSKEVENFNLDEAAEYDTSLYHSWRREIVEPTIDEILKKIDRSWITSMLAEEQMSRNINKLIFRSDVEQAINNKVWIELQKHEIFAAEPNLTHIWELICAAAILHVNNLLLNLESEGVITLLGQFGGRPSNWRAVTLTDKYLEKETADFNLDEGKSFSEFTHDDKRLISIIKKEFPLSFVKRLVIKEIISNQSTSTRSDTCFRLLVRRNVASVMCSNKKREDVWNAINEYTEFVINVMCLDGELASYEDEQTGHDMIGLANEFLSNETKDFNLDETLRAMIRVILS